MKIMITGARGNFATALDKLLAPDNELVLYDLEPMGAPENGTSVQGDIRDAAMLTLAMRGCDAVIHAAAYHGNAAASRNEEDYYSVNVTGTHNVLRAMLLNSVKYLVFSSSEVVYGEGMCDKQVMDEEVPCIPDHIYPLTKQLGEEMCRFYARQHGFKIAMLRYGCFVPADWRMAGLGRLNNWLDREDVAQANELALGAVVSEAFSCEAFLIHSQKPVVDSDWPELTTDPVAVVERYYPGATELLSAHGMVIPLIHTRYDITKAVTMLGYDPQHNFEQFLSRLRSMS
jgi:UDP-glucose 4-epimerase